MSKFDAMTPEEIGQLFPIEVVPYDERWPQLFMAEAARVSGTLYCVICAGLLLACRTVLNLKMLLCMVAE